MPVGWFLGLTSSIPFNMKLVERGDTGRAWEGIQDLTTGYKKIARPVAKQSDLSLPISAAKNVKINLPPPS